MIVYQINYTRTANHYHYFECSDDRIFLDKKKAEAAMKEDYKAQDEPYVNEIEVTE